tara:strand:- start:322 stop:531 length:210 start_codon:yes stop_codon:yes gene_type:complete
MSIQESILHKAKRAVKLSDAELSIVVVHMLTKIEELENELEKVSANRPTRTKATKRNVPTTGVSGQTDS